MGAMPSRDELALLDRYATGLALAPPVKLATQRG